MKNSRELMKNVCVKYKKNPKMKEKLKKIVEILQRKCLKEIATLKSDIKLPFKNS